MKKLGLFLMLMALGSAPVMAEEGRRGPKDDNCKEDIEKFCKEVKPGEGRVIKCLAEHKEKVSTQCNEAIEKGKERREERREDCKDDVKKFCDGKEKHDLRACMKENEAKLSNDCKEHFKGKKYKKDKE